MGPQGEQGEPGQDGADGSDGADGEDGADGKDGRNGRDFGVEESLALGAALALPAWLETHENFAISGGVGFSDSETALGATGIVRIDRGLSGFAGAAVSTGGDYWAGKAGVRYGW